MNPGLNNCVFSGNLAADPKVRETNGGEGLMATASIGVGRFSASQDGKTTDWVNLVAFGKQAEIMRDYLKKGSKVEVVSRFQSRSYEQDGETKYITEFIVQSLVMAGKPGDNTGNGANGASGSNGDRATQAQPSGRSAGGAGAASAAPARTSARLSRQAPPVEDDPDDLPF